MRDNQFQAKLGVRPALAAAGIATAAALLLTGCGDSAGPNGSSGPDLSTVQAAIAAQEDFYSRRQAEFAIALLASDYTFTPALPESIPFLQPGQTSWNFDQEKAILNEMLVPERTSWLDQVLLDIKPQVIAPNADSSVVVVEAQVELEFLIGTIKLEKAKSDMTMSYRRDAGGDYRLFSEVEAIAINSDTGLPFTDLTVGELRSQALEDVQP